MDVQVQSKFSITIEMTERELHDIFLEIDEILNSVPETAYGFPDLAKLKFTIVSALSRAKENSML